MEWDGIAYLPGWAVLGACGQSLWGLCCVGGVWSIRGLSYVAVSTRHRSGWFSRAVAMLRPWARRHQGTRRRIASHRIASQQVGWWRWRDVTAYARNGAGASTSMRHIAGQVRANAQVGGQASQVVAVTLRGGGVVRCVPLMISRWARTLTLWIWRSHSR